MNPKLTPELMEAFQWWIKQLQRPYGAPLSTHDEENLLRAFSVGYAEGERAMAERAAKVLQPRIDGFRSRSKTIFNGAIVADELEANQTKIRSLVP